MTAKTQFIIAVLLAGSIVIINDRILGQDRPLLVPVPQVMELADGTFSILQSTTIVLGKGCGEEDRFTAELLNDRIWELAGFRVAVAEEKEAQPLANCILLGKAGISPVISEFMLRNNISVSGEMRRQGYALSAGREAVIIGGAETEGIFNGVMTLLQLLEKQSGGASVRGIKIEDWPDMPIRGISHDISRGQVPTMDTFKRMVRFLARYKMNSFHIYLEDMFRLRQYPTIGKNRGALTAEAVKELTEYARNFHVDIVPMYQSLGHQENLLLEPEFQHLGEFPGSQVLGIAKPEIYSFLKDVYSEIIPAFSSPYFGVGCDESWDVGLGATKGMVGRMGVAETHLYHYNKVYEMVKSYGKRVLMYDDIVLRHPENLNSIPKDIIMVDWHYGAADEYASVKKVRDAGFDVIVAPGISNWGKVFPAITAAAVNIRNITRDGVANGAIGMTNTNWGDWGAKNLHEFSWYGYAYGGACSWNSKEADQGEFGRAFFKDYFGTESRVLPAIYSMLEDASRQIRLWDMFTPPFAPEKFYTEVNITARNVIRNNMELVLGMLPGLYTELGENREHLDYLEFAAQSGLWYIEQMETQSFIKKATFNIPEGKEEEVRKSVVGWTQRIMNTAKELKETFNRLWLEENLEANLEYNLNEYDYIITCWEEALELFKAGRYGYSPLIQNGWIYHADTQKEKTSVPHAYFRKTFFAQEGARELKLQTIGDTYLKIWVNGGYQGESAARWSLSSIAHQNRAKIWTVPLRRGKNVIAIEAQNFDEAGRDRQGPASSAGVHVYGEVSYSGGNVDLVISDDEWLATDREEDGWTMPDFYDGQWRNVYVDPERHYAITKPDFGKNRASWIVPGM